MVKVVSQTYSEASGVPVWVTTFEDMSVGRYLVASAHTLANLVKLPRYAAGTKAGEALRFAASRM